MKKWWMVLMCALLCLSMYAQAEDAPTVDELLSDGQCWEAMAAARFSGTEEGLRRSYEIEHEHFWYRNAININGGMLFKSPSGTWHRSSYTVVVRKPDDEAFALWVEETASKNKATFKSAKQYKLTGVLEASDQTNGHVSHWTVLLEDGTVKNIQWQEKNAVQDAGWYEYPAFTAGKTASIKDTVPWENIVHLSDAPELFALRADGTVAVLSPSKQPDWTGIVDIAWTGNLLIGLKNDGTLCYQPLMLSDEFYTQVGELFAGPQLKNIVDIDAPDGLLIAYRDNGNVFAVECAQERWYIRKLTEMTGVKDVKPVFLRRNAKKNETEFIGLTDDGRLVSTIANFPETKNIAAFEVARSSYNTSTKNSAASLTVFTLSKDGEFDRFSVENVFSDYVTKRKNLPALMTEKAVKRVNKLLK